MKRLFNISVLILLYVLFTAKSCESDEQSKAQEEAQTAAVKDSVADAFASDTLSNSALRAYEATARLKVYDFMDYMKILADTATGDIFKAKAGEMIGELFISREVHLNLSSGISENGNHYLNRQILHAGFKNIDLHKGWVFDSIAVLKPLQKVNDTLYEGKLGCQVHFTLSTTAGIKMRPCKNKDIQFFLIKREKIFGDNSIKVWTILLGNIE